MRRDPSRNVSAYHEMLQVIRPYVKKWYGRERKYKREDGEELYIPRRKLTASDKAKVTKYYEAVTGERFNRDTGRMRFVDETTNKPVGPGFKGARKRGLLQGGDGATAPNTPAVRELLRRKGRAVGNLRGAPKFKALPFPGVEEGKGKNKISARPDGTVSDENENRTRTYFPYSPYKLVRMIDEDGDEDEAAEDAEDEEYHKAIEKIIAELGAILGDFGALASDGETFKPRMHATIAVGGGEEGGGQQYDTVTDLAERFIELIEEWKRKYGKASKPEVGKNNEAQEWIHGFYVTKITAKRRTRATKTHRTNTPRSSSTRAKRKRARPARHHRRL